MKSLGASQMLSSSARARRRRSWLSCATDRLSAKELALSQPAEAWQNVTWSENGEAFTSRFARWRVRPVIRAEHPPLYVAACSAGDNISLSSKESGEPPASLW
jgi:hypothetical protein